MNYKKVGIMLFGILSLSSIMYGRDKGAPVVEVIQPERVKAKPYEEDDFLRIRRAAYSNGNRPGVREFLYFSRWHEYLDELAEEKLRQKEYEHSLQQYEKEKERVDRKNQKIRQQNQSTGSTNVPQGNSVDISKIQNLDNNSKDNKKGE